MPIWITIGFGTGIAFWILIPDESARIAISCLCIAGAATIVAWRNGMAGLGMAERCLAAMLVLVALGMTTITLRTAWVAPDTLARPYYGIVTAHIVEREDLPARNLVRFRLDTQEQDGVPRSIRVNLDSAHDNKALRAGAVIRGRVRLMPPAQPSLPGSYNFARRAWYEGLGATGRLLDPPEILRKSHRSNMLANARQSLSGHVRRQIPGPEGALAATLATGDRGAILEADAEAMRQSGLAHLLSISGLHVSAVIGVAAIATIKLLALWPPLARRWRLPYVAAFSGAVVGIAYTAMTGAEVPTIRACIAALLILLALVLGRDPISMRLVAAGALAVLLAWPEALLGPSFQLSFAAVTAIVALHDHPWMRQWSTTGGLGWGRRAWRFMLGLFATGLAIEFTLLPIALFHFHKAGLYGAVANLVAIPLTTFVVMPLEAAALLFDIIGWGEGLWWLCGAALRLLLALAHHVSSLPGAVSYHPPIANGIFALFVFGGLWLFIWRSSWRYAGLVPVALATILLLIARPPDLLITGDGRHVAVRSAEGRLVMLRKGAGDYMRDTLFENAGLENSGDTGAAIAMVDWPKARCSDAFCVFTVDAENRFLRIMVARNGEQVPERALAAACRRVDLVISDRWLPYSCRPARLKIDRKVLARTGGLSIDLASGRIRSVAQHNRGHPWFRPPLADIRSSGQNRNRNQTARP